MCPLTHFNNINDILQWGRSNHDNWVGIFPTFQQSWQCAAIQEPGRNRKWELTVTTFNSFWKYLFSALFFSLFIFDLFLETQTLLAFMSDNKLLFTKMNIYKIMSLYSKDKSKNKWRRKVHNCKMSNFMFYLSQLILGYKFSFFLIIKRSLGSLKNCVHWKKKSLPIFF